MSKTRSKADLLGPEPAKKRVVSEQDIEIAWNKLYQGVSLAWLAGFCRMNFQTVKKRLGDCPTLSGKNGQELYDPMEALSRLVKPKFDIGEYIRNMNPNELPPMLRKEYWDAAKKQIEVEQLQGELWRTEDVHGMVSDAFKVIKNQMQVWIDDVERECPITPEQYQVLNERVDALRQTLAEHLQNMEGHTPHVLGLSNGADDNEEEEEA